MKAKSLKLKRLTLCAATIVLLAALTAGTALAAAGPDKTGGTKAPKYVPGDLIVKIKDGYTLEILRDLDAKFGVTSSTKVFPDSPDPRTILNELNSKLAASPENTGLRNQVQRQQELVDRLEARQKRAPQGAVAPVLDNIYLLRLPQGTDVPLAATAFKAHPAVAYAEPNYLVEAMMTPNDPYYSSSGSWGQNYPDLWGVKSINSSAAWDTTQGQGVVVAVVDTGIDYTHEDLAGNIWQNAGEQPNNGIDDDGNGYVDDVRGWDFAYGDNNPMDSFGHGSHVAGTIAAKGNNTRGVVGVAPMTKLMAVKGIAENGSGTDASMANSLVYAANNGADVLNNSWGGEGESQLITDAINYAYSHGCVVLASAGNNNDDTRNYIPANLPQVITVAASNPLDKKADFSSYGSKVDVSAPGEDILSSMPDISVIAIRSFSTRVASGYYRLDGTSMACPHAAGAAALVLANHPGLEVEQVRYILRHAADDIELGGWDMASGYGRLNAAKTLTYTNAPRLFAAITSPALDAQAAPANQDLAIAGGASGAGFSRYDLSYAAYQGSGEGAFTTIAGSRSSSPVANGTLGTFPAKSLTDGEYIVKLNVYDAAGLTQEARIHVRVKNAVTPPVLDRVLGLLFSKINKPL